VKIERKEAVPERGKEDWIAGNVSSSWKRNANMYIPDSRHHSKRNCTRITPLRSNFGPFNTKGMYVSQYHVPDRSLKFVTRRTSCTWLQVLKNLVQKDGTREIQHEIDKLQKRCTYTSISFRSECPLKCVICLIAKAAHRRKEILYSNRHHNSRGTNSSSHKQISWHVNSSKPRASTLD
jgi:hypothetical protein